MKKKIYLLINYWRIIIAWLLFKMSKHYKHIIEETDFWCEQHQVSYKYNINRIGFLLVEYFEFRNVLCMRLKSYHKYISCFIISVLFPQRKTLYILTSDIGKNLFIQHGFSTIVSAKKIGDRCWINQQVTIGYEQDRAPIIGNDVRICAGAIIIGDVKIGDNSIIGAGSVVTTDIPSNQIWGGVPARYIKKVKGSSFDDQRI